MVSTVKIFIVELCHQLFQVGFAVLQSSGVQCTIVQCTVRVLIRRSKNMQVIGPSEKKQDCELHLDIHCYLVQAMLLLNDQKHLIFISDVLK